MDENLLMNQNKIENTVSIRLSFFFFMSLFFSQSSVLSLLKSALAESSHYPYSLT